MDRSSDIAATLRHKTPCKVDLILLKSLRVDTLVRASPSKPYSC